MAMILRAAILAAVCLQAVSFHTEIENAHSAPLSISTVPRVTDVSSASEVLEKVIISEETLAHESGTRIVNFIIRSADSNRIARVSVKQTHAGDFKGYAPEEANTTSYPYFVEFANLGDKPIELLDCKRNPHLIEAGLDDAHFSAGGPFTIMDSKKTDVFRVKFLDPRSNEL